MKQYIANGTENIKKRIFNCQKKDQKYYLRFYTFWATAAGQKVSGFLLISGSILSAVYQIAPHTVLIKFVRDYYQNLTYGIPTPVRYSCVHLLFVIKNILRFRFNLICLFLYNLICSFLILSSHHILHILHN